MSPSDRPRGRLRSRAGRRLHEGLVGARGLVGTPYLADTDLRQAYERDIAPRTEAALARVLAGAWSRALDVRRALDLGAGTGAGGRSARARFGAGVEVVSVDRLAAAPGTVVADVTAAGRPPGVVGRFDLVIAAHLMNELTGLSAGARARLVESWCRNLLAPAGRCVIVEPALRETSRALLAVRDLLVAAGLAVLAPCLRQGRCPALARRRDWCHDSAPAGGGTRVDFSYLVLGRESAPVFPATWFRVVSDLLPEKGRLRLYGCGPAGRSELLRLDRDASAANAALDRAARGDVVVADRARTAPGGLRVERDSTVERLAHERAREA